CLNAVQTIIPTASTSLYREQKNEREERLHTYHQTILNPFAEVNSALVSMQSNLKLVLEHQKQVQILGDILHLSQLRYNEGEVDSLSLLDAEIHLNKKPAML